MANTTPIIRCPKCEHPINDHGSGMPGVTTVCCTGGVPGMPCPCVIMPNEIAVAAIHQVLFGDLTQTDPGLTSVSRQPDGTWS